MLVHSILRSLFVLALVMTRSALTNRFFLRHPLLNGRGGQAIANLSLLTVLLFTAGCSGSRLGSTLGRSLEPDPQLAQEAVSDVETVESAPEAATSEAETPAKDEPAEPSKTIPAEPSPPVVAIAGDYTDLGKAPEEIQPYLIDLIDLDLLKVRPPAAPSSSASGAGDDSDSDDTTKTTPPDIPGPGEFRPNRAITRREYARWLLATNNKFYAGVRTRKIRPGVTSSTPVFQDVKADDPDFDAIQGLAEAGIIPSPLTGSSTTLTFRPDAPLTRKDLLLWKVPLDTRQPLPQATPTAVEQAWGFQDANRIEARALQAVLADYQNGDFANIRRAFGYTTLFQPDKAATRAEAAAVLWRYGNSTEGITAEEVRGTSSALPKPDADAPEGG